MAQEGTQRTPPGVRGHSHGSHSAGPNRSGGGTEADGCLETSGQAQPEKERQEGDQGGSCWNAQASGQQDLAISLC